MPRPTPRPWLAIVVGAMPWTWYLVRDLDARLDVVALLWPVIGIGGTLALAGLTVLQRKVAVGATAASWLVATLAVVLVPWMPAGGGTPVDPLRIVAANTYWANVSPTTAIAQDLFDQQPDVLIVSEIGLSLDRLLTTRYRYRVREGDVAVFSQRQLRPLTLLPADQEGFRVEVDGRFLLYALHLQKPSPWSSPVEVGFRTHRRIVDEMARAVEREREPVVLAGDLNLVDRSSGYRRLDRSLDDAMRDGWGGPTSQRRLTRPLLARIDHVFMPESWCSDRSGRFDIVGSDHRGIAVDVGPCATGAARS